MFVSTFELLIKPQLPKKLPKGTPTEVLEIVKKLRRTAIQGYFLTLANTSNSDLYLKVIFTIKLPKDLKTSQFITFFDAAGEMDDLPGNITQVGEDKYATSDFKLAERETVLLILQPDFIEFPDLLNSTNFEARGYTEVFLAPESGSDQEASVLAAAEHRGTFFRSLKDEEELDIGQLSYGLPIQNGGLLTLKTQ